MAILSYTPLKTLLFKLDPETAHTFGGLALRTVGGIGTCQRLLTDKLYVDHPVLRQRIFGRTFANPVGLAAGFDKDGDFVRAMPALGFGFTEIGTVTPKPQPGNPKPRLFRHIKEEAIQNAMGFNNKGSWHMIQRLKKLRFFDYPVGINIGKNKVTPENEALKDYETLFRAFADYGTYIVINISSPNTPGLRNLQNESFIREVFRIGRAITDRPILLKIAPDMEPEQAVALCETAIEAGAAGIIATNTTVDYSLIRGLTSDDVSRSDESSAGLTPSTVTSDDVSRSDKSSAGLTPPAIGGISGAPLREKSFELFRAIAEKLHDRTLLISVGGIDSAAEAYRRIRAGASLIQVYTGLIYHGPTLARDINTELIRLIKADGFTHISEAIGADWR